MEAFPTQIQIQMYLHISTSKLDLLLIRRSDLAVELNFHLTEYQTGRLGRLDEMNEPSRQVRQYHLATFDPSHLAPGGRGGRGDRVYQHGDGGCQAGRGRYCSFPLVSGPS